MRFIAFALMLAAYGCSSSGPASTCPNTCVVYDDGGCCDTSSICATAIAGASCDQPTLECYVGTPAKVNTLLCGSDCIFHCASGGCPVVDGGVSPGCGDL